jgi:hypothetical protein
LPAALAAAGPLLLAAAGYEYLRHRAESAPIAVEAPERELTAAAGEALRELTFTFHNPRWQAVRVIGLAPC